MILSTSAISTAFKKVLLATTGVGSVIALSTAGANAVSITPIVTTVGEATPQTFTGSFLASDLLNLNVSGTVDIAPLFGSDSYTTNAAGILTVNSAFGNAIGTAFVGGFGGFSDGALLIGNDTVGFKQVFASDSARGLGSSNPPTNLSTGSVTLGSIFGTGFTSTGSLQFKIYPLSLFAQGITARNPPISIIKSFASVPNVYTLNGTIGSSSPTSTSVPEPLTIIGTLIGGTAAMRMRKKLKASA